MGDSMKRWIVALALLVAAPAFAQGTFPLGNIPSGKGTGKTGYTPLPPGTAGNVLTSNGPSVDASFSPIATAISLACTVSPTVCITLFGYVNPVWYGADPTGASDSTSAFNSSMAASSNVRFPPGKFKFLSAINKTLTTVPSSITIKGAGAENTILYWPNATNGITINYTSDRHSSHISDLSFTTGATNVGWALKLNNTVLEGVIQQTNIENVTFRGDSFGGTDYWNFGIKVAGVSNVNFLSDVFYGGAAGAGGTGIILEGVASTSPFYGIVYNIDQCAFFDTGVGINYGTYIQGVTVNQSNFTNGQVGIFSPTGTIGAAQLTVTNSQFNTTQDNILIQSTTTGVQLIGNLFYVANNFGAVVFGNAAVGGFDFVITGNLFEGFATVGNYGVLVTSTAMPNGIVSGNIFHSLATGIQLGAGTSDWNVQGNMFSLTTTSISNAGTNRIVGNIGYNPVGPAVITVGASPFTYTAGASPETVYIWNGTVSAVNYDKNGGPLVAVACNASPCTVELGPYEQAKVTYTVIPIMNKMVH
jgi:hypothetical protein